jgi:hypothetical protein
MSSSYGDGGFFFLKPVGAGPGYPGSTSGYGELAFDGQVYSDGKEYPVQAPLRLGYGDADYGVQVNMGSYPTKTLDLFQRKSLVLDWRRMQNTPTQLAMLEQSRKAARDTAKRLRDASNFPERWITNGTKVKDLNSMKYIDGWWLSTEEQRNAYKEWKHYDAVAAYYAEGIAWLRRQRPYVAPSGVVRQGFRPTPQTIPSDLRGALARLMARRAQARTQAELRALQMEIARLQQMLMMQAAAAQQTAPAITQMPPVGMATAPMMQAPTMQAPMMEVPAPTMVPEGAVQAMPDAEEVKEKQVVGLDAAAGASTEEPTFLEKYGLFLGLGALAVGGYWYMNREKKV